MLIYFDAESKQAVVRHLLALPGQGGIPGGRPHRGDLRDARPADQAQDLALPEAGLTGRQSEGVVDVGFRPGELLPYYLDETDEQIAGLSDALLKLERIADRRARRSARRSGWSTRIKGSSTVLGFDPVKDLTHHLETYLRPAPGRQADPRPAVLDLCFRCLDALRDYHQDLRARGESDGRPRRP